MGRLCVKWQLKSLHHDTCSCLRFLDYKIPLGSEKLFTWVIFIVTCTILQLKQVLKYSVINSFKNNTGGHVGLAVKLSVGMPASHSRV